MWYYQRLRRIRNRCIPVRERKRGRETFLNSSVSPESRDHFAVGSATLGVLSAGEMSSLSDSGIKSLGRLRTSPRDHLSRSVARSGPVCVTCKESSGIVRPSQQRRASRGLSRASRDFISGRRGAATWEIVGLFEGKVWFVCTSGVRY